MSRYSGLLGEWNGDSRSLVGTRTCLQDLWQVVQEMADHLREHHCNKKDLKNLLWQEIEDLIRSNVELQTNEIPASTKTKSGGSSKGETKWKKDEVDEMIQSEFPEIDDKTVFAHRFVDETLVPRFLAGLFDTAVAMDAETYPADARDLVSSVVLMFLQSRCVSACC